jgi:hypothetical protein
MARTGLSAAAIARRKRKSPGYVSVVLFLGEAIEGRSLEELRSLRSRRITIRVVQRLVTLARHGGGKTPVERVAAYAHLIAALLDHARASVSPSLPSQRRRGRSDRTWTIAWDHQAFIENPTAYARRHLDTLSDAHRFIADRATEATRRDTADQVIPPFAGNLWRRGRAGWNELDRAQRSASDPGIVNSLTIFATLTGALREVRRDITRLFPAPTAPAIDQSLDISVFDIEDDFR